MSDGIHLSRDFWRNFGFKGGLKLASFFLLVFMGYSVIDYIFGDLPHSDFIIEFVILLILEAATLLFPKFLDSIMDDVSGELDTILVRPARVLQKCAKLVALGIFASSLVVLWFVVMTPALESDSFFSRHGVIIFLALLLLSALIFIFHLATRPLKKDGEE